MSQTVEATKTENLEAGSEAVTVSGPSFTRTTITPEMAKDLLATAPVGVVAEVDDEAVASYAATMEADGWLNNGMTIVLDTQGHLIHGIQRLNAVVKSGVSIETFIARNIDRDVLHTFDQHRKRSYQSVLETRGVQHPGRVTRLMSKLIRLENGMLGFPEKPISWSRYDLVFKANPEIVEAVAFSDRFKDTYLHSTARPTLCFMALRAGHREKLIQFMTQLRKNIPSDRNFAPGALRHQFGIVASSSPDGLLHQNVETLLAWGIQAFNMFLENKEVEKPFSWRPDYGVTPLDDDGKPLSTALLRKYAPANLGMPVVKGYSGLRAGVYDYNVAIDEGDFQSKIIADIRKAKARKSDDPEILPVTVTPAMARQWLRYNTGNRSVQESHIQMIARDISSGRWQVNADPIAFTRNPLDPGAVEPRLLNGQHRLLAIIRADTPVDLPIAYNIAEEAFATFDVQKKRSQHKAGNQSVDERVLAAAAKLKWKEDQGLPLTGRATAKVGGKVVTMSPTISEQFEVIEANPGFGEAYRRSRRKDMQPIASSGVLTYFINRVLEEHAQWGEDFLNGIETGAELKEGDPLLKLRRILVESKKGMGRGDVLELLLDSWSDYKSFRKKRDANQ